MRVLLVSTTGMGDCLWGTPGIRALKKTFPEIEIDLVVNKSWKSLFDFNPYLNSIFEYYSDCLLYTSPSPRDRSLSRMPSSA